MPAAVIDKIQVPIDKPHAAQPGVVFELVLLWSESVVISERGRDHRYNPRTEADDKRLARAEALLAIRDCLRLRVPGVERQRPPNPLVEKIGLMIDRGIKQHGLEHICKFSEAYWPESEQNAQIKKQMGMCGPHTMNIAPQTAAEAASAASDGKFIRTIVQGEMEKHRQAANGAKIEANEQSAWRKVDVAASEFIGCMQHLGRLDLSRDPFHLVKAKLAWDRFAEISMTL